VNNPLEILFGNKAVAVAIDFFDHLLQLIVSSIRSVSYVDAPVLSVVEQEEGLVGLTLCVRLTDPLHNRLYELRKVEKPLALLVDVTDETY
jgi:hypothetical protein